MMSARKVILSLGIAGGLTMAGSAIGQEWQDNFDSYADGSSIHGQGDWTSWDGDATWESFVSSDVARSAPHSLKVEGDSDTIFRFDEQPYHPTCGQWTFTCYVYVPDTLVGADDTYFILLDDYEHGAGANNHWAMQNHWDPDTDMIIADFDNEMLPTVYNEWVELRTEIDLDNDAVEFYYGGDLLLTDAWTSNVNPDGFLTLDALDLFAFGATAVYYDDFSLTFNGGCPPDDCLVLENTGYLAGADTTWTVSGGTPGQKLVVVYGFNDGNIPLNGFEAAGRTWCALVGIAGVNPSKIVGNPKIADGNGEATWSKTIPGGVQGQDIKTQALGSDTCPDPCDSAVDTTTVF